MEENIIKNNKIAFIMSVNNKMYLEESCAYLDRLTVPQGYEVEVFPVWDSTSMCQAYNIGMRASDAKYKIYIHQDVFIAEKDFLINIINIFEADKTVGMIGMIGAESIPASGVFFSGYNIGKVEVREPDMAYYCVAGRDKKELMDVLAVDGVLIATQVDIPWREDLFTDYDFYDASQGLEFIKAGYRVVVPAQKKPWIIHDCSFVKLWNYDKNRAVFVENYTDFLTDDGADTFKYDGELDILNEKLARIVKGHIDAGDWDSAEQLLSVYKNNKSKNTELENQCIIDRIYRSELKEKNQSEFYKIGMTYSELKEKYIKLRFAMRRYELGWDDDVTAEYENQIMKGEISLTSVITMLPYTTLYVHDFLSRKAFVNVEWDTLANGKKIINYIYNRKHKLNIVYGRKFS